MIVPRRNKFLEVFNIYELQLCYNHLLKNTLYSADLFHIEEQGC